MQKVSDLTSLIRTNVYFIHYKSCILWNDCYYNWTTLWNNYENAQWTLFFYFHCKYNYISSRCSWYSFFCLKNLFLVLTICSALYKNSDLSRTHNTFTVLLSWPSLFIHSLQFVYLKFSKPATICRESPLYNLSIQCCSNI